MDKFVPGQCWISDAELKLGLGTITQCLGRTIEVIFLASGESRTYAQQTAPLTRINFVPGDTISSFDGINIEVTDVNDQNGLLTYVGIDQQGQSQQICENRLNPLMQLNRPSERLFNAQTDHPKWYELRYQTFQHLNRLAHSELQGLTGGRTSLIPHQLYIAHEVAGRYAPRILLADEVGLGKTIEAGMILHRQMLTQKVKRVLIIVPESLLHQWLIEMLRRFNIQFSLFDESRCIAEEGNREEELMAENADGIDNSEQNQQTEINPFFSEQLVLTQLEFLVANPKRLSQALSAEWDLMIVDEAHHLQWSEQQSSPEYQCIEQLAQKTPGVLLLTATPEQLGKESHFARLRLLDADRFPSFQKFLQEEEHYQPLAEIIEELLADKDLSSESLAFLENILEADDKQLLASLQSQSSSPENLLPKSKEQLINHLLDRHGTGRVLYRNTRSAVSGFPERQQHGYPLAVPDEYVDCLAALQNTKLEEPQLLLCPELLYQAINDEDQSASWLKIDPRVDWLGEQLQALKNEKILVIAASADTAQDLNKYLKQKYGLYTAVFHEDLSLIERDRAAAYFADQENGSQVLICSEIGSEGRNFQFSHHLVLFDLPLNPDLLEQRIGRLDRIGQQHTIQVHIPYLQNTAQEILYRWYQEGLAAFEHNCPAGHKVFTEVADILIEEMHQIDEGITDLDNLVTTTRELSQKYNQALQQGRDQLLEYNSCRPHLAQALLQQAIDKDENDYLDVYLEKVFDCYGVDSEHHKEQSTIIRPGDKMQQSFPMLPDEGLTYTCDRETALANDDMHYLTWEHPMVVSAMDMVTSNEKGNTSLSAIKLNGLKPGTMLMECLFIVECIKNNPNNDHYELPPELIRVLIALNGKDYGDKISFNQITKVREKVDRQTTKKIIDAYTGELRGMLEQAEKIAQQKAPKKLATLYQQISSDLDNEVNRLIALQKINPNVRDAEINFFQQQKKALKQSIETANIRLDAVRILVAT